MYFFALAALLILLVWFIIYSFKPTKRRTKLLYQIIGISALAFISFSMFSCHYKEINPSALILALIILSISWCINGLVYAQDFTNESLQGKYAVKASISPKIVGMGVATVDENGNLTVSGMINRPALFDRRAVSTISIQATLI